MLKFERKQFKSGSMTFKIKDTMKVTVPRATGLKNEKGDELFEDVEEEREFEKIFSLKPSDNGQKLDFGEYEDRLLKKYPQFLSKA